MKYSMAYFINLYFFKFDVHMNFVIFKVSTSKFLGVQADPLLSQFHTENKAISKCYSFQ